MSKWNPELVQNALGSNGLTFSTRPIEHGTQFCLPEGTLVNLYNTGKVNVQGKASDEKAKATAIFAIVPDAGRILAGQRKQGQPAPHAGAPAPRSAAAAPAPHANSEMKVFIVYGHDTQSRNDLELLLLRLGIRPIVLANINPQGQTIIEALYSNSDAHFAVALLTADDIGHPAGKPEEARPRARQNVILELGMFLMKLGRERVAILLKEDVERPSDIEGLIYIPFDASIQQAKNKLASALQNAGFHISIEALSAE